MGWIYCLTFPNGKQYVGLTTTPPARRFSRHKAAAANPENGSRLYLAWRKHGAPSLQVLAEFQNDELAAAEREYILALNSRIPHGYNQGEGGEGPFGVAVSEETRRKISEAQKGKIMSEVSRQRMAAAKLGRRHSDAHRAAISAALKGKPKDPEAMAKTHAANVGRVHSAETRAKISANRKGIKRPPEASERAAAKHRGRKNSPETIEKMKASALRRHNNLTASTTGIN